MARIGLDTRLLHYRDGGISTYIRNLIKYMDVPIHHDLTLYASRKDKTRQSPRFDQRSLWTPAHHRWERLALSVELWVQSLDIWHSPDFIPPYRGAHRHVITVHDLTFLHYPQYLTADSRRYYNAQIETACHQADAILAVSQATRDDLVTMLGVPQDKIYLQPHGVDKAYKPLPDGTIQDVLQALDLPQTGYFLHVGTLEPRKNIVGLLDAYHQCLQRFADLPPLVLVGRRGWLFEETEAHIERLKLGEQLIRRENVSDTQLPAVYHGAIALISPSYYEGFGMPALEAMACGTVPIVSNNSSLPEVVGDVGLLVDAEDTDALSQAMERVWQDSAWRAQEGQRALQRAKTFSWEKSAQIAIETYERIL
jgi:glycosyltransferase involved in cell wall biosynthesis